jgi:hypothetical protein
MNELHVDPARIDMTNTGFFVRAIHDGKWGSHDISALTRQSLLDWLRSRGGENEWAEDVVLGLLGHVIDDGAPVRVTEEMRYSEALAEIQQALELPPPIAVSVIRAVMTKVR